MFRLAGKQSYLARAAVAGRGSNIRPGRQGADESSRLPATATAAKASIYPKICEPAWAKKHARNTLHALGHAPMQAAPPSLLPTRLVQQQPLKQPQY
mmetsp:Transcript_2601/g.5135  ORF Transcript_2601/g.5135 Transcript_2601/m.5135 type:complete len:97 (+) Transcript_2601:223-513(+)